MNLFDKLWKKVTAAILVVTSSIFLALFILLLGVHHYYVYSNIDDWVIMRSYEDAYCYAIRSYDNGADLSISLVNTESGTTMTLIGTAVFDPAINISTFPVLIGFSRDDFDPRQPLKSYNGAMGGIAQIENGNITAITFAKSEDTKKMWDMFRNSSILVLQSATHGIVSFETNRLRYVLIKSMECTEVEFNSEEN